MHCLPWIARTQYSRQTVTSFYRHQSSSGDTGQAINRRQPCFPSWWPKDLERPARRCNIFPIWIHLLPPAQNVAFQEDFTGHHHLMLTASWLFSLGLSVPALRQFCRLRSTIWCDILLCLRFLAESFSPSRHCADLQASADDICRCLKAAVHETF